jgi:transcriptional regulator with XRE-family HTH domain
MSRYVPGVTIDWEALRIAVVYKRYQDGQLTYEQISDQSGVGKQLLVRLLRYKNQVSAISFMRLTIWLGVPAEHFVKTEP